MLWFDTFIQWLHLMSAAIWVGGSIFVGIVLTPIARRDLPAQARYPLFAAVGKRFGLIGRSALLVLIATGVYKISLSWGSDGFWESVIGRVIIIKIALLTVMIALNLLHDFVWGPRLAQMSPHDDPAGHQATLFKLSFWSRVNVVIAVVMVFLGAFIRMNPF